MSDQIRKFKIQFEADTADVAKAVDNYLSKLTDVERKSANVSTALTKDGNSLATVFINSTKSAETLYKKLQSLNDAVADGDPYRKAVVQIESLIAAEERLAKAKAKTGAARASLATSDWDEAIKQQNNLLEQIKFAENQRILSAGTTASRIKAIEQQAANDIENIQATLARRLAGYDTTIRNNPGQVGIQRANASRDIGNAGTAMEQVRQQASMNAAMEAAYAEHYQRNLSSLNQYISARANLTDNALRQESINIQYGATSRQAIEFRANQASLQEQTRLTEQLNAIRRRAEAGSISAEGAQARVDRALQQHRVNLNDVIEAQARQTESMRDAESHQRGLIETVTQYGIAWRITNGIISTAINALRSIPSSGIEMQSTISALNASLSMGGAAEKPDISKGEALTGVAMKYLQQEAERTGIALTTLEKNYRTFLASAKLAGESTNTVNSIFANLNTTITALHMSGDRAELTFLALSQMFNKSKVQSEELTKQLGNLLPGAFAAFATATGRTTQQLVADMKAGTVSAHENIAKFIEFYAANYAGAFAKASQGLNAAIGREQTAWTNFARGVFIATESIQTNAIKTFTDILKFLTPTEQGIERLTYMMKGFGDTAGAVAVAFSTWWVISKLLTPVGLMITLVTEGVVIFSTLQGKLHEVAGAFDLLDTKGMSTFDALTEKAKIFMEVMSGGKTEGQINDSYSKMDVFAKLDEAQRLIAIQQAEIERIASPGYTLDYAYAKAKGQDVLPQAEAVKQSQAVMDKLVQDSIMLNNQAQEITLENSKATGIFNEASKKDLEEFRKTAYAAETAYAEIYGRMQNIREEQAKMPNAIKAIGADGKEYNTGFVPLGDNGLTQQAYEEQMAIAAENLRKAKTKQEVADSKEAGKAIKDAYADSYRDRENDLKNHLSAMENLLSTQKGANEYLLKTLELQLKAGTVGLKEYYAIRESLIEAGSNSEMATLQKQREELDRAIAESSKVLSTMPASIEAAPIKVKVDVQKQTIRSDIEDAVNAASTKYKVPADLIKAMINQESAGNSTAVSGKGAGGLMQLMPGTFASLGYDKKDFLDIATNIDAGTKYIKQQLDSFQKVDLALAAYNAGPGAVLKYGKAIPPYAETQNYVKRITGNLAGGNVGSGSLDLSDTRAKEEQALTQNLLKREEINKKIVEQERARNLALQQTDVDYIEGWKKLQKEFATPDQKYDEEAKNLRERISLYSNEKDAATFLEQGLKQLNDTRVKENQAIKESIGNTTAYNTILKQMDKKIANAGLGDKALWLADQIENLSIDKFGNKVEVTAGQIETLANKWDKLNKATQNADLIKALKDGFISGFSEIIDKTKSFGEVLKSTIDTAIKSVISSSLKNLVTAFEDAFSSISKGGSINWSSIFSAALPAIVGGIASLLTKSAPTLTSSNSQVYSNNTQTGSGAQAVADSVGRQAGFESSSRTVQMYNAAMDNARSAILSAKGLFTSALSDFGSSLMKLPLIQQGINFFKPVTDVLSNLLSTTTNFFSDLTTSAFTWMSNLFTTTSTVTSAVGSLNTTVSTGAMSATSDITAAASSYLAVIGAIYSVYSYFTDLGSLLNAGSIQLIIGNTIAMVGAVVAGVSAALYAAAIAAGSTANPIGIVVGVVLAIVGALISAFTTVREPNYWFGMVSDKGNYQQNPTFDQSNKDGIFTTTGNKSAYAGIDTALGEFVISSHEMSLSGKDMINQFGGVLVTVRDVNNTFASTIDNLDKKFNQTGQTLESYRKQLEVTPIGINQQAKDINVGLAIDTQYQQIIDMLAKTGTEAGTGIAQWFDMLSNKFSAKQKADNPGYTLSLIQAFSTAGKDGGMGFAEMLLTLPKRLISVIDESISTLKADKPFEDLMVQAGNIISSFASSKLAFSLMGDKNVNEDKLAGFLGSMNKIGMNAKDATNTLIGFASSIKNASNVAVENLSNIVFNMLDNIQAALGSSGLSGDRFSGALSTAALAGGIAGDSGITYTTDQLVTFGIKLNDLASSATDAANAVIDHAIATANLGNITREDAITQLQLAGTLDATKIAAADFGVSLTKVKQTFLDGVGFASDIALRFNTTLGAMGVSFDTLTGLGDKITSIFGDVGKASTWVDNVAKAALTTDQYNQMTFSTSAARYTSAAEAAGVPNLSPSDLGLLVKNSEVWKNLLTMMASSDPVLNATAQTWYDLINAGMALKTANDTIAASAATASTAVDTSASALASYGQELRKIGKSDIQSSIEDVYTWRDGMIAAAGDIAATLNIPQAQILDYIQTIASSRYTAAIKSATDALKTFNTGISDWVANIKATKIGTPDQQFASAWSNALDVYNQAKAGDPTAMGKVTSTADSLISSIEARYGSSDYANSLKQQVVDAVSGLPEQLSIQSVIQSTSDAQVTALYAMPASIADAIAGKSLVIVPTTTSTVNLADAIIPTSNDTTTSSSSADAKASAAVADVVQKLEEVKLELQSIRKDQRQATEAIVDSNFIANGAAADGFTDAVREQTANLIYNNNLKVGLA